MKLESVLHDIVFLLLHIILRSLIDTVALWHGGIVNRRNTLGTMLLEPVEELEHGSLWMSLVAGQVEVLETELGTHTAVPLVVVNERPAEDASDIDTIKDAGSKNIVKEALDVVGTSKIPKDLLECVEVLLVWISKTELGDHDALGSSGR